MHVRAADAWLSIGELDRANAELAAVGSAADEHPDVLEVRWHLHARAHKWNVCAKIARKMTQITPERSFGWFQLALSLRQLNRCRHALRVLIGALEQFGPSPGLWLSLACCHARLQSPEAATCLEQAFQAAGNQDTRDRLLLRAFEEPDLEHVWEARWAPGANPDGRKARAPRGE